MTEKSFAMQFVKEFLYVCVLFGLFIFIATGVVRLCTQMDSYQDLKKQTAVLIEQVKRIESFREGFLEGKKALIKQQEDLGVIITQVPKVQTK